MRNWRWTSPFGAPLRRTGHRIQERPGWTVPSARGHGRTRNGSIRNFSVLTGVASWWLSLRNWRTLDRGVPPVRGKLGGSESPCCPTRSVPLSRIGMEASVGDDCRVPFFRKLFGGHSICRSSAPWRADGCAPDLADVNFDGVNTCVSKKKTCQFCFSHLERCTRSHT